MDSGEKWKIFNDPAKRVTKCRETLVSSSLRYRGSDKKPNREFSTRIRIEAKSTRIVRKMDIEVSFVFFFFFFFFVSHSYEKFPRREFTIFFFEDLRSIVTSRSIDLLIDAWIFIIRNVSTRLLASWHFPKRAIGEGEHYESKHYY